LKFRLFLAARVLIGDSLLIILGLAIDFLGLCCPRPDLLYN